MGTPRVPTGARGKTAAADGLTAADAAEMIDREMDWEVADRILALRERPRAWPPDLDIEKKRPEDQVLDALGEFAASSRESPLTRTAYAAGARTAAAIGKRLRRLLEDDDPEYRAARELLATAACRSRIQGPGVQAHTQLPGWLPFDPTEKYDLDVAVLRRAPELGDHIDTFPRWIHDSIEQARRSAAWLVAAGRETGRVDGDPVNPPRVALSRLISRLRAVRVNHKPLCRRQIALLLVAVDYDDERSYSLSNVKDLVRYYSRRLGRGTVPGAAAGQPLQKAQRRH